MHAVSGDTTSIIAKHLTPALELGQATVVLITCDVCLSSNLGFVFIVCLRKQKAHTYTGVEERTHMSETT